MKDCYYFPLVRPITPKFGDHELIYVIDFLKMLWNGDIF